MGKLKLEINALRVESFDTTAMARASIGTVRAHNEGLEEVDYAIPTPQTRDVSCIGTCTISCWGSCLASCLGTCDVSCNANCTDLCSLGCSDGCTAATCPSGGPVCCA